MLGLHFKKESDKNTIYIIEAKSKNNVKCNL
jgi:hypothetical protein